MTNLLDYLQENGYDPEADAMNQAFGGISRDTYELTVSGVGTVRLTVDDSDTVNVYRFDGYMVEAWHATFTASVPMPAVLAALAAAEDDLAVLRGGPVTPRQDDEEAELAASDDPGEWVTPTDDAGARMHITDLTGHAGWGDGK